jgi:hypothetical protein
MSDNVRLTLTKVEQCYVEQGYRLPPGITWAMVHAARKCIDPVRDIDVPLASAGGCTAWGVPIIDGKHLDWRSVMSPEDIVRLSTPFVKMPKAPR